MPFSGKIKVMAGLFNRLRVFIEKSLPLEFDWIQVEVTSACNAACVYCPRTIYRGIWQDRHMTLETFYRLQPLFRYTKLLYLQGWGEPFLNPEIFKMIGLAKSAGCMVGMTSNAMALKEDMMRDIIKEGVDILGLSLAGSDRRNDDIRKGTRITKVLETIDTLRELKSEMKSNNPKINIAYMLLRSGIEELPSLAALLEGRGINQLVISTLDFRAMEDLAGEDLSFLKDEDYWDLQNRLDHIKKLCSNSDVQVHSHIARVGKRKDVCTENILKTMFVSADGTVSPCVYLNVPIEGGNYYSTSGQGEYKRLVFGSLKESTIQELWHREDYRRFRDGFINRRHNDFCLNCPKLYED